ncbi:MAG: membrane protein insertion efficiency factor YidD [Deltaproteobacteria bacterium]|nr:membrane protein insertion efficiency factor YidD [Deltaproteobacteria bacterium]
MKRFLVVVLKTYRLFVAPYLPGECRYYPTCSAYAIEAIEKRGVLKGVFLVLRRILKCNPFYPGGYDPVK